MGGEGRAPESDGWRVNLSAVDMPDTLSPYMSALADSLPSLSKQLLAENCWDNLKQVLQGSQPFAIQDGGQNIQ